MRDTFEIAASDPAVLDIDKLEQVAKAASAVAPGRWHWSGNTDTFTLYLATWIRGAGRCSIMGFRRWGMGNAQPTFLTPKLMMRPATERTKYEVGSPQVTGVAQRKASPNTYRADVVGVDDPIATHIAAASPDIVLELIALIRDLQAERRTV